MPLKSLCSLRKIPPLFFKYHDWIYYIPLILWLVHDKDCGKGTRKVPATSGWSGSVPKAFWYEIPGYTLEGSSLTGSGHRAPVQWASLLREHPVQWSIGKVRESRLVIKRELKSRWKYEPCNLQRLYNIAENLMKVISSEITRRCPWGRAGVERTYTTIQLNINWCPNRCCLRKYQKSLRKLRSWVILYIH